MDSPNRQLSTSDTSPDNHERVKIEDYRGPMNDLSVPPPNISISAPAAKAEPASSRSHRSINRAYNATQTLSWIGLLSSLAFSGLTLYVFVVTLIVFHRSVTLAYELPHTEGIIEFGGVIVSYTLCLVTLLRARGNTNQRASQRRSWIGLILSAAAIVVSSLTYFGVL